MTKSKISKSSKKVNSEILTQSQLKKELYYDQFSGVFRKVCLGYPPDGGPKVGTQKGRCQISIYVNGKSYYAAHLAVLWMEGRLPEKTINFKNGIKYDNRWKNLTTDLPCNKSGVDGVYWSKRYNGWRCRIITRSGSERILGTFGDMEETIRIMHEAQKKYDDDGKLHWKDLAEIVLKPQKPQQSEIPPEYHETAKLVLNLFQGAL